MKQTNLQELYKNSAINNYVDSRFKEQKPADNSFGAILPVIATGLLGSLVYLVPDFTSRLLDTIIIIFKIR